MTLHKNITLQTFRGGWFARITSALTLFFFSFVFYINPTSLAVADELTKNVKREVAINLVQFLWGDL